ncbi:MAG: Omp28-related outer membrane protein [Nonlabens sp.]|jgi:thiol-disulfide isomerase/thioredoxin|uniref:Omp28-related outer membrane protein n=1 Tax=Nonlabens sp. TaxID=1888209 RepID=UPI0035A7454E
MKTLNYFKVILLVIATAVVSCSTNTIDDTSGGNNGAELVLSVDKSTVYEETLVTFTVIDGVNDATSNAIISVDGVVIAGNTFTMSGLGTKEITSTVGVATTNSIDVDVIEPSFTTKVLIEDYTGTWCGWCPRIAKGIEEVKDQTNGENVISIAVHNNDPMVFSLEAQMRGQLGVTEFPTGTINRNVIWQQATSNDMNTAEPLDLLTTIQSVGLSINSTVNGSSVDASIKVGFDLDVTGLKLVAVLLENGVIEPQLNYTSHWPVGMVTDFEHNDVLRSAFTDIFGDVIPAANQVGGGVYRVDLTTSIPVNSVQTNWSVVAFVVDADNKVVNVQKAAVGANVDFD